MSKYEPLWKYIKENNKEEYLLSYEEIENILGFAIDHSFLTYKKELLKYGYNKLISAYPQYKKNKYLKMKTIKNIYYKSINKFTYKLYSNILRKIYRD